MSPSSLQLGLAERVVDSIISAADSKIKINAVVAPWEVNVDHASGQSARVKKGGIVSPEVICSVDPKRKGHLHVFDRRVSLDWKISRRLLEGKLRAPPNLPAEVRVGVPILGMSNPLGPRSKMRLPLSSSKLQ